MNLMEKFADPQLMQGLSTGEKLIGSGVTALMGIGITFLVLVFLWGCIVFMSRMMVHTQKSPERLDAEEAVTAACDVMAAGTGARPVTHVPVPVIAAAVHIYEGRSTLQIRKISRLPGRHSWSQPVHERKVIK